MRIGIFGGSFNPPHKMHLDMALELLDRGYVDKIIYVPTGSKYKYKTNLILDKDRYNMLKLMIGSDKRFEVSNFELKDHIVYTWETLEHFEYVYPNDEIYFICGVDNLSYLDSWVNGVEILKNYKILVVRRNTDSIKKVLKKLSCYKDNIIVTDVLPKNLSSTKIRDKISKGEDISSYLDSKVLNYIMRHNLYGYERGREE